MNLRLVVLDGPAFILSKTRGMLVDDNNNVFWGHYFLVAERTDENMMNPYFLIP